MYYPYFRGKQFELLLLREMAQFLTKKRIHPIIEPVRQNPTSMTRAIKELITRDTPFIFVVNPMVGDMKNEEPKYFDAFIADTLKAVSSCSLGYIVDAKTDINAMSFNLRKYHDLSISVIHYGYDNGEALADTLSRFANVEEHIFIDEYAKKLYQSYFGDSNCKKILVRDGFIARKNAE